MSQIVFGGVSPRSLGDLLKGYGIMAILGEERRDTQFWWDDAFHLVAEGGSSRGKALTNQDIEKIIHDTLPEWARTLAQEFKPTRQKSCAKPLPCPDHPEAQPKGKKKTCPVILIPRSDSKLKRPDQHDAFSPELARWARAIALPEQGCDKTWPHPLFPFHGQEGSGDYFSQVEKAVAQAYGSPQDLLWSLFAQGTPTLQRVLDSGYLFFPEPMKRYATGITKWEREKDAPVSPWCFLLAIRGAMLLRGSIRRLRWGRRSYPAFPFVFEGSTVKLGGEFYQNDELHLPTWGADRPRTLAEFEMQVGQFQARLSARGFAATAAEFRAAVVGRGAGAAFETFHRFVLEGRRPGQRQPMRQGIPRGLTRVGGRGESSAKLRLMLAPLAEKGWFDQFTTDCARGGGERRGDPLRAARVRVEEAIDRAVDELGLEAYRGVLEALWELNRSVILPGALRREFVDRKRTPRPLPPLPAKLWEEALGEGLRSDPAYRLGRAIGSILGVKAKNGAAVGPVLEHMLPVTYRWDRKTWTTPDPPSSRPLRWSGLDPLGDFRTLLWYRWLDSGELERLPFAGARCAPLSDVVALLRGEVDVREVHRLAALFALLDWQEQEARAAPGGSSGDEVCVPPAYAVLRLWLELGIDPASESRPPRDCGVVRLLNIGQPAQAQRAIARALSRLRVNGLPWDKEPRPTGKAVAHFEPEIGDVEAARLAVAVIVPIAKGDRLRLSRRLWVGMD